MSDYIDFIGLDFDSGWDQAADEHNKKYLKEQETILKENVMNMGNARVLVNDKIYAANSVDWIQTPGEFPRIRVEAYINPSACLGSNYPRYGYYPSRRYSDTKTVIHPDITNVIFNPPATIVFWSDKTKTVVKCDYDLEPYDPEKGIAMAISKKLYGNNKYEYYNTFKHWLKKWDKQEKAAVSQATNEEKETPKNV